MTTTTGINGTGNNGTGVLSTSRANFDDNPFLQLLTEQLRNQTPLEPVDNASFMNQMAQYSSMTEQKQLNNNLLKLLDYQGVLARLQGLSEGSALLGKQVTYDTDTQQGLTGNVRSVYINDQGEVRLRLESGEEIAMQQVTGISAATNEPPAAGSTPPASNPGSTPAAA